MNKVKKIKSQNSERFHFRDCAGKKSPFPLAISSFEFTLIIFCFGLATLACRFALLGGCCGSAGCVSPLTYPIPIGNNGYGCFECKRLGNWATGYDPLGLGGALCAVTWRAPPPPSSRAAIMILERIARNSSRLAPSRALHKSKFASAWSDDQLLCSRPEFSGPLLHPAKSSWSRWALSHHKLIKQSCKSRTNT